MDLMLSGKVVLVTGAGSGIGRAAAIRFAEEGASIAVCDLDEETGRQTTQAVIDAGGKAVNFCADVASAGSVKSLLGKIIDEYGRIDVAVNNAGVGTSGRNLVEITEEDFDRLIAINLKSVWLCMREEIPLMLGPGGVIINTASVMGLVATTNSAAYIAAKHGVIGLTKAAAMEYSAAGIRINAVCPGATDTALVAKALANPDARERMLAQHPIGRFGRPIDIAEAMVWLASPRASFVTGAAIPVDGGWTAH